MSEIIQASFELPVAEIGSAAGHAAERIAVASAADIRIEIFEHLSAIEQEWREFEQQADGTVFQSYAWLATWHRFIGVRNRVRPAVVVGRNRGAILFFLPLAVRRTLVARELTWLGSELCDYNAPLLAPEFTRTLRSSPAPLIRLVLNRLRQYPQLRFDIIRLGKMPEKVGAQPNPLLCLPTLLNPSGAYMTQLGDDWETFYRAKRSASTRRRDRTKRNRLSELGEVRFVDAADEGDKLQTLDILMEQKARSFARNGVANLFARPGYREFYRAVATDSSTRQLIHVSRLQVGSTTAAANLGLTFRGCYYHLLASYDDGVVSKFGPGATHLHEIMHYAIDHGFRFFDFTIGDERYKRDWCELEQRLYDHISGVTLRGLIIAPLLRAVIRFKRWIKQTPAVWSAAVKAREVLGLVRSRNFRALSAQAADEHVQAKPPLGDQE